MTYLYVEYKPLMIGSDNSKHCGYHEKVAYVGSASSLLSEHSILSESSVVS